MSHVAPKTPGTGVGTLGAPLALETRHSLAFGALYGAILVAGSAVVGRAQRCKAMFKTCTARVVGCTFRVLQCTDLALHAIRRARAAAGNAMCQAPSELPLAWLPSSSRVDMPVLARAWELPYLQWAASALSGLHCALF